MPPKPCTRCISARAVILRPKTQERLCKSCFLTAFEEEVHHTIIAHKLFTRGERVAIGASGGKDSSVLASVLVTLNARYDYGLDLCLLSIDEGIKGYRDDSLACVQRNAATLGLPLTIVGYDELYGWTMDQVVSQIGKKGNCTYCGVFRRQALDRGAARLGVQHVVTGHNCDDVAETVMMNLLRGDLPRLARATSIVTSTPGLHAAKSPNGEATITNVKRSKPLKYAYEKEIVLYAHHKALDYFSTECIYSPEAFRGSARALIKNLERIRPSSILDIVKSGEDMARLVPGQSSDAKVPPIANDAEPERSGCGREKGQGDDEAMADMEQKLQQDDAASTSNTEIEITSTTTGSARAQKNRTTSSTSTSQPPKAVKLPLRAKPVSKQTLGQCVKCGYLSSQAICKACVLLEGLNRNRPQTAVQLDHGDEDEPGSAERMQMGLVS